MIDFNNKKTNDVENPTKDGRKLCRAEEAETVADSQLDQQIAALIAKAVEAKRTKNQPLVQKSFLRLRELGIPLICADELEHSKTKQEEIVQVTHDKIRMTESKELMARFTIELVAPMLFDHTQLPLTLFRVAPLSDDEYARLLHPLDAKDTYLRTAIDETFTAKEMKRLQGYFTEKHPSWQFTATPAKPIAEGTISETAICVMYVGGPVGQIFWAKEGGGSVPNAVCAFGAQFDFRRAKAGPYINDLTARSGFCCAKGGTL